MVPNTIISPSSVCRLCVLASAPSSCFDVREENRMVSCQMVGRSVGRLSGGRSAIVVGLSQDGPNMSASKIRQMVACVSVCVLNCKPCTTPTHFLQTVEKRIVKCAPLLRVFYKPLRTVLQTVHHSHAFFTNRGFFKETKNFLFSPLKNPRFVKNAWEWCTVCNTVLNSL